MNVRAILIGAGVAALGGFALYDYYSPESRRARALFARMDSALAAGHLARFGVLYDSLRALLRGTSRGVAPSTGPR